MVPSWYALPARISNRQLGPIVGGHEQLQRRHGDAAVGCGAGAFGPAAGPKLFANRLKWQSIRYVTNQNKRFGSCTPMLGTIRISHRLAAMPESVFKYVVVHELAHLEEANHGPKTWALVRQYPLLDAAVILYGHWPKDDNAYDFKSVADPEVTLVLIAVLTFANYIRHREQTRLGVCLVVWRPCLHSFYSTPAVEPQPDAEFNRWLGLTTQLALIATPTCCCGWCWISARCPGVWWFAPSLGWGCLGCF